MGVVLRVVDHVSKFVTKGVGHYDQTFQLLRLNVFTNLKKSPSGHSKSQRGGLSRVCTTGCRLQLAFYKPASLRFHSQIHNMWSFHQSLC